MKICHLILIVVAFLVSAPVWNTSVLAADRKAAKRDAIQPVKNTQVAAVPHGNLQMPPIQGTVCYFPGVNGNPWGTAAAAGNTTGQYPSAAPMQTQPAQLPQAAPSTCYYYPNNVCYDPVTQFWGQWGVPAGSGSQVSSQSPRQEGQNSAWNQAAQAANARSGDNYVYYSACVPAWHAWY